MRFTVTRVLSDPALAQDPNPPAQSAQDLAQTGGASAAAAAEAVDNSGWNLPLVQTVLVGSGGQGDVYKAENVRGDVFALKFFNPNEGFLAEYEFFKKLARQESCHPNLLKIYGGRLLDNRPALIMEYIQGADFFDAMEALHTHMKRLPSDALLAMNAILTLGAELFSGLAHLERLGLSHGDIKPDNLMITPGGDLKIIDFGFASEAKMPVFTRGTVGFMGPELTRGGPSALDRSKADTFAAANTLLGLLTGYQIGQNFESLVATDFCYPSSALKQAVKQAHFDKKLVPEQFNQSLAPEVVLGVSGTFFGLNPPNAEPESEPELGSETAIEAAAVPISPVPQAMSARGFVPNNRDPLAGQLVDLLSKCIRSDWHQRPSAAQMCADLETLKALHMRPADAQEVKEFLKRLVEVTPAHKVEAERIWKKENAALNASLNKSWLSSPPPLPSHRPFLRARPPAAVTPDAASSRGVQAFNQALNNAPTSAPPPERRGNASA